MTDSDDPGSFTTWDGEPISRERPHGATIVLASLAPHGWRYLLLHRAHHGPAWAGDWAWTPPSGARKPGESVIEGATRELLEETGLSASPRPVRTAGVDWALFTLEVPWGTAIAVDGTEHDQAEWVSFAEARRRLRPTCWTRASSRRARAPASADLRPLREPFQIQFGRSWQDPVMLIASYRAESI